MTWQHSGKTSLLRAWADRGGQVYRLAVVQVRRDQLDAQELADAGGDTLVVIDDLHELNSPDTLGQLTQLLTNLPDGVHAMLTTRHDLPLRLHQLRLAGELTEIRAADLQFTEPETRQLLAASGIVLSEAVLQPCRCPTGNCPVVRRCTTLSS